MRHGAIGFLFAAVLTACARPIRTGPLIDRYDRAICIPVRFGPGIQPPTRAWDHMLKLRDGSSAHVVGAQLPGGRINVKYTSDGQEQTAANAGDYIYPADVRFDQAADLLYVKAKGGPAAFGGPQTWIFEYDLQQRRQTGRVLVDPRVLPQECPETP